MKLYIGTTAAFLIAVASASAEEVSDLDRFRLWNKCRPTNLVVEGLPKEADSLGLTKNSIEVTVRSRLRGARLFTEDYAAAGWSYLYINLNVVGNAFDIEFSYAKYVEDEATGLRRNARTWRSGTTGTHGKNSNYILASVSHHTDEFIDEYLRVNDDACKAR